MPALLKLNYRYMQCCYRCWRLMRAFVIAIAVVVALPANAQTITTDEAVARAQQQVPGKLVAVSKEQQGDQPVYRVRILSADGVVRTVFINASR